MNQSKTLPKIEWRIEVFENEKGEKRFAFTKWINDRINESYGFSNSDIANINASLIINGYEPIHPLKLVKGAHIHNEYENTIELEFARIMCMTVRNVEIINITDTMIYYSYNPFIAKSNLIVPEKSLGEAPIEHLEYFRSFVQSEYNTMPYLPEKYKKYLQ